jgi:hypothetical protein
MIVLTVQIDQRTSNLGEFCDRRKTSVDITARATLGRYNPSNNTLEVSKIEASLNNSLVGSGTNHRRFSFPSDEQLDRRHDQRLSRAGLARYCSHPGREHEGQLFDHTEIANSKFTQHLVDP